MFTKYTENILHLTCLTNYKMIFKGRLIGYLHKSPHSREDHRMICVLKLIGLALSLLLSEHLNKHVFCKGCRALQTFLSKSRETNINPSTAVIPGIVSVGCCLVLGAIYSEDCFMQSIRPRKLNFAFHTSSW